RKYPCGDTDPAKDKKLAVFNQRDTSPVDAHPDGASPFGIMDMAGNVLEWVADWYCNKYNKRDTIDPKGAINGHTKVLRGGSWCSFNSADLRGAYRDSCHPEDRYFDLGFRVIEEL
ncbi:SUMF1/EgtB/PvdO family nonheme iron enzyme, partial [Candidatus Saganbacteria bacterium]|nr:SUMF1/EgtB/PvdO family nonheme iron enzyme [Candidatus Saganbacteria bacterium]